jgi:hypothetical protein
MPAAEDRAASRDGRREPRLLLFRQLSIAKHQNAELIHAGTPRGNSKRGARDGNYLKALLALF